MSPSEKIRALLDELGIEWKEFDSVHPITVWHVGQTSYEYMERTLLDGVTPCTGEVVDGTGRLVSVIHVCTPEQAIAATVGNGTDLSKRLREVHGLHAFAELFGFDWYDGCDWNWHDVACAMADAIDAAAGTTMTLDEATERIEKFMGDYAKVLLASTLYMERGKPTNQHAFDVAEQKEAQMARTLAEALATVGVGTCEGSFHESSDLSSGRVPLYYCKGTNKSIFIERETRFCPLCGKRITKEATE